MVDVTRILQRYRVPYKEEGESPNCARGHVVVQCPYCGPADHSEHMGIRLADGVWGCWRDQRHRGRELYRLLVRLLNIPIDQAKALTEKEVVDLTAIDEVVGKLRNDPKPVVQTNSGALSFLPEFKELSDQGLRKKFSDYLRIDRNIDNPLRFSRLYNLKCVQVGAWKQRIIIPVFVNEKLVQWTARSIYPDAFLRYKSLTDDPEKALEIGEPCGLSNIKHVLLNYDGLIKEGGSVLYVTEGPFDALNIDYYGRPVIRATCLFGLTLHEKQLYLLSNLQTVFDEVRILLDEGQYSTAMRLKQEMVRLSPRVEKLPAGVDDPGELTEKQIMEL